VLIARLASLVHARNGGAGWLARRRERDLISQLTNRAGRLHPDLTGYDTLVGRGQPATPVIDKAYEISVMPRQSGRARAAPAGRIPASDVTVLPAHFEIEATIGVLSKLRKYGKKVKLKSTTKEPFWKLVVLGDYIWVQHCHSGFVVRSSRVLFALQHTSRATGCSFRST